MPPAPHAVADSDWVFVLRPTLYAAGFEARFKYEQER